MAYMVKQGTCIYSYDANPHFALEKAREWIGPGIEVKAEDSTDPDDVCLVYITKTLHQVLMLSQDLKDVKFSRLGYNKYGAEGESVH